MCGSPLFRAVSHSKFFLHAFSTGTLALLLLHPPPSNFILTICVSVASSGWETTLISLMLLLPPLVEAKVL